MCGYLQATGRSDRKWLVGRSWGTREGNNSSRTTQPSGAHMPPPPTESELANRSYDFGMLRKSPQERQAWASHFTIIADVSPGRDAPNLKRGIDIMNRESQVVSSLCPHDRFLVTNPSSPPILCDGQRPIKAWLAILEYGTKISSPSIPLLAAEPFLLLLLITLLSVINTARIYQGLGYSRYPGALLCE